MVRSLRLKSSKHSRNAGLSITHHLAKISSIEWQSQKCCKDLETFFFEKCKNSGVSEFQALLDWRNTPTDGMATSPAQRLIGRRCRTLLPTSECLLRPSYSLRDDVLVMSDKKRRQKEYYDRYAKPLPDATPGEMVRMRLPGQKVWTPAACLDLAGPRSSLMKSEVQFFGETDVTLLKLARLLSRTRPWFQ